ncbi:heterokaryon incompatibility protein-domain-containing protein [Lenzites betulinus]|nr:heterokaryon incompatibility protein-domain-containing protein [Lenzites betulinus]
MPRFLNTHTGEFVWLADVGPTPYAILSHTWRSAEEGGEQTFDDLVKLQAECPIANSKPWNDDPPPPVNNKFFSHSNLSAKIRRACEVARKAGFRLIWIDSCCIDKRSSAELSEAINSMYALYRDADVCYVYLADVPRDTNPRQKGSMFWNSKWHGRGWTLQELVAPSYVVFLTCDWTFLGTKTGLASMLEQITGVDATILLGMKPVESASVAKRMSWAAYRQTTRVEDRAYSLLGIFGVHMSPIYGEGTNAFLRLQEEIIKHIPDQSIFAWGLSSTLERLTGTFSGGRESSQSALLAPSPDAFWDIRDVAPISASEFAMRMGSPRDLPPPPLHCVFTPQGVRMAVMTILLPPETALRLVNEKSALCPRCKEVMNHSPLRSVALLRCTDRDGGLIALPLRCGEQDVGAAENVVIGVHATCGSWRHGSPRVLRLSAAALNGLDVAPACVEVFLLRHSSAPVPPKARRQGFSKYGTARQNHTISRWCIAGKEPEIRLAPNCEEELRAVGFPVTSLESHQPGVDSEGRAMLLTTVTLNKNIVAQRAPWHDGQDLHVSPIQIELRLLQGDHSDVVEFSVDRLRRPSATESTHAVSPAGNSFPSTHPMDDTPATADNEHRQSSSFDVHLWISSRTIAETEFVIHDCTGSDGGSTDLVRLLRLRLECPLEDAYIEDWNSLLFSVDLSELFINATSKPTGSSLSQQLADILQMQAVAQTLTMHSGLSPGPNDASLQRHDAIPQSAMPPNMMYEQTVIRQDSPGSCTASNLCVPGPYAYCISPTTAGPDPLRAQESSNATSTDSEIPQQSVRSPTCELKDAPPFERQPPG